MTLQKSILLIALVTFSVLLYAHEQISKTLLLYDIHGHQQEKGHLDEAHYLLRAQVSQLASPPALETLLAREDLLLEFPENRQVIHLASSEEEVSSPTEKRNLLDFLSATKVAEAGNQ